MKQDKEGTATAVVKGGREGDDGMRGGLLSGLEWFLGGCIRF